MRTGTQLQFQITILLSFIQRCNSYIFRNFISFRFIFLIPLRANVIIQV